MFLVFHTRILFKCHPLLPVRVGEDFFYGPDNIYKEPRFTNDTVMTLAVAKWLTIDPESIISYLEADSYTSAIRNAISLGGDADTMACMAGGIAVATKGMELPEELARCVYNNVLDDNLRQILDEFNLYLKEHKRE